MPQHTRSGWFLMAAMLMTVLVGALCGDLARADDPDFTNVPDILNGRRHLLRVDDLAIAGVWNPDMKALGGLLQTSNSTITQATSSHLNVSLGGTCQATGINATALSSVAAAGRMFNLDHDVVLSAVADNFIEAAQPDFKAFCNALATIDPDGLPVASPFSNLPFSTAAITQLHAVVADFTGDGYDDIVLAGNTVSGQCFDCVFGGFFQVLTAADPDTPSQGVKAGTLAGPFGSNAQVFAFAAGVFQAPSSGQSPPLPLFAQLSTDGSSGKGLEIGFFSVDPNSLVVNFTGKAINLTLPEGANADVAALGLAAGHFSDATYDQLVVAYTVFGGTAKLITVDFDTQGNPVQKATLDTKVSMTNDTCCGGIYPGSVILQTGRFDPTSLFEQAALQIVTGVNGGANTGSLIEVLSFDADLNITASTPTTDVQNACHYNIAVGNFDHRNADGTRNLIPQIADVWTDCTWFDTPRVNIWNVDPTNEFAVSSTPLSTFFIPSIFIHAGPIPDVDNSLQISLVAADLQGRSLRLGPPTKVSVTGHIQPDIVLGIPPLHIDWINPVLSGNTPGLSPACQSASTPCLLNLTVMPSLPAPGVGFSTQYAFSSSAASSASRKSTTSYSFSTKEIVEAKVSYGVPNVAQVSVDAKFAAQQTHDNTVAMTYNTYGGKSQSLSSTTGFADHLFNTKTRFNIWYYPVIGQLICPADQPDYPDSDTLPLHVQFSGPDMADHQDIDATTQEWYQPIHEPGNVFSDPWTVAQLQQSRPNLVALTGDPDSLNWRGTDTSTRPYGNKWNQESGRAQSSGLVSTNKIDASVTVAAQGSIESFGISGSAGFEVNSSQSVSTLNTLTQTVGSSTGIQVYKPECTDLVAENYLSSFAGYVLGQTSPDGTLQTILLTEDQNNPINIQSTGPLTVAFLADPFQVSLPWWRQAYTTPDVGLNHPECWDWSKSTQTATFNPADQSSSTPQDQAFYHIKGLFITLADASGTGPQLTQATAGDTLQLQACVYNFSLADMPAGAQVHVQRYAQVYENAQLVGSSFLIGEATLPALCGFNSSSQACSGQPNWGLASTTFDTSAFDQTKAGDMFLIFWVLVWMQNGQGNVVAELPDYGLTSSFTPSTTFAQITHVPIEAHSNNVGFYGYTGNGFYIASPGSELAATPTEPGDLAIDSLRVESPGAIPLDQKTQVTVSLRTGDTALGALSVVFYDGEPDRGGTPFDVMHVARLRANETSLSRVFFRPQTCGPHTLVAVAGPATPAPAIGRTSVDVTLGPVAATGALIATMQGLALPQGLANSLLAKLEAAEKAFAKGNTKAGTNQLNAYINEVQAERGKQLTAQDADRLIGQADVILSCV